jgi:hypothetical protein
LILSQGLGGDREMTKYFVATAGVEAVPLQDGAVLYNMGTSKFVMLNYSLAFLWGRLAAPRTAEELFGALSEVVSGGLPATAGRDIENAIDQLAALKLVATRESAEGGSREVTPARNSEPFVYEAPSARVLSEDELLNIFQMTAAEISVASCWWGACATGCP